MSRLLSGSPGDDGGAAVAAFEQSSPGCRGAGRPYLLRLGGVALVAVFDQDGADFLLEELGAIRRQLARRSRQAARITDADSRNPIRGAIGLVMGLVPYQVEPGA